MSAPAFGTLRSSQCPQVQGRGREEELQKSKRGTGGKGEAEQGHMRGTTGENKMYSRGTQNEQQMYSGGTAEALHRTENT